MMIVETAGASPKSKFNISPMALATVKCSLRDKRPTADHRKPRRRPLVADLFYRSIVSCGYRFRFLSTRAISGGHSRSA